MQVGPGSGDLQPAVPVDSQFFSDPCSCRACPQTYANNGTVSFASEYKSLWLSLSMPLAVVGNVSCDLRNRLSQRFIPDVQESEAQ